MEANGHLVAERPGLTRNGGGVEGNHRLGDAKGPALSQADLVPRALSLQVGTSSGPLAGSEQCLRQEAGRHGTVPAHLGSAWWLAGTEQWTAFGLGSASPARRLRGRAVNANSLEQALRETSWGPFAELSSHDSSADRWTWDPRCLARRVYTQMGMQAP